MEENFIPRGQWTKAQISASIWSASCGSRPQFKLIGKRGTYFALFTVTRSVRVFADSAVAVIYKIVKINNAPLSMLNGFVQSSILKKVKR